MIERFLNIDISWNNTQLHLMKSTTLYTNIDLLYKIRTFLLIVKDKKVQLLQYSILYIYNHNHQIFIHITL